MKKGFTLIEITVVVLLLAILSIFIVPKVSLMISDNKGKACESIERSAEEAAEAYSYMHITEIDQQISLTNHYDIRIGDLQNAGLLKKNIENPYDGGTIPTTNNVRITKEGNSYIYTYMGGECN